MKSKTKPTEQQNLQKRLCAQAMIIVMLISTICVVIVSGLALRTARRIREARRVREYQIAYGQAMAGLQAMSSALLDGSIEGRPIESCSLNFPCELLAEGENQGYEVSLYPIEDDFIEISKDRSVDLWLPAGNLATKVLLSCKTTCGGDLPLTPKGITATVIAESAGSFEEEKFSLSCGAGSAWGFGSCTLPPGGSECSATHNFSVPGEAKVVRVKAFTDVSSCVSVYAAAVTAAGDIVSSTGGYKIDSRGYGYDGASATVTVVLSPAGLPYPFDFSIYDG